jgi:hypothetical protein
MYISYINIKNIEKLFNNYNIKIKVKFDVNTSLEHRVIKEYDKETLSNKDDMITFYTYYLSYKSLLEVLKFIDKNEIKTIEILKILSKTFPNVFDDYFNSLNNS